MPGLRITRATAVLRLPVARVARVGGEVERLARAGCSAAARLGRRPLGRGGSAAPSSARAGLVGLRVRRRTRPASAASLSEHQVGLEVGARDDVGLVGASSRRPASWRSARALAALGVGVLGLGLGGAPRPRLRAGLGGLGGRARLGGASAPRPRRAVRRGSAASAASPSAVASSGSSAGGAASASAARRLRPRPAARPRRPRCSARGASASAAGCSRRPRWSALCSGSATSPFVVRRLVVLGVLRILGHRVSISIGSGFWAACGWSGPA